ncbi:tRNA modification GTPase trmE [Nitrosomonas sp. PY1]|uniref:tRNA uridine-5-carboxymethylaminomethyl(34) synthesis GTPase MnmE n=1 Tax=Nitrosomonas sp. PY1 TaxID=1803906 RepID=UPI001FC8C50E|nr:tRNA uridine-5-carboxymethylaminomethyl(34) synthesis GTPase MnmE [Nitrosomonas sp. PY1]GKS68179.1 tRNA modification GTPase trmE [Nitrosomonas sp. PY1]
MANSDTIAAIATPPGRGGIGVIRISGADLKDFSKTLLGKSPIPRQAMLQSFLDAEGRVIDQGIALFFPAPYSYTGEDVLELQGHGGPAIQSLLLNQCLIAGARLAQPGEFTLRAYLNNKIDLIQAESVADLIEANTYEAARCATNSLRGDFSKKIEGLVNMLTELRMFIEATINFPEDNIGDLPLSPIEEKLRQIDTQFKQIFQTAQQGKILKEGIRIVLAGEPNVGKSSLLNQLAEDDVAIVTEIPGTTRDVIERTITIEGIAIHIIDTAGLRETSDIVERKGIERTHAAIKNAHMIVWVMDISQRSPSTEAETMYSIPADIPRITVHNKIDLINESARIKQHSNSTTVNLSAKTGAGIDLLRKEILAISGWRHSTEGLFTARQRHLEALTMAQAHLNSARTFIAHESQLELLAEDLRLSQLALSSITGEFTADDLLGEIFSHFCIGK